MNNHYLILSKNLDNDIIFFISLSDMKRDIGLDSLRGLLLVWMTLNHLGGPLHAYSFQTLGFFSSAEGFVFISGVVAGLVYGRIGLKQGSPAVTNRTLRRARDI